MSGGQRKSTQQIAFEEEERERKKTPLVFKATWMICLSWCILCGWVYTSGWWHVKMTGAECTIALSGLDTFMSTSIPVSGIIAFLVMWMSTYHVENNR